MIKQGDKFGIKELRQSVQEVCSYTLNQYVDMSQGTALVIIGDSVISPIQCGPHEYAKLCTQQYAAIPSSAINLEQQLRAKGLKTAYRFSHKYHNGGFTPEQIVHDAYCLDWFHQIYNTTSPADKYAQMYFSALDDAFHVSYYYAQYLWANNPGACKNIAQQLKSPIASNWGQIISCILGIGFQFHPSDIYEYAAIHTDPHSPQEQRDASYARQLKFKNYMQNNHGIDTGCLVLSQQNREKLDKIVTGTAAPYFMQVIQNLITEHRR